MSNFTESPGGGQSTYIQARDAETGEVCWIPRSSLLYDSPQDIKKGESKWLIVREDFDEKVTKTSHLSDKNVTFKPFWGRLGFDGARSLRMKGLTALEYDVLMYLVEQSRYGNKVAADREVIAAVLKASVGRVGRSVKSLDDKDVLAQMGSKMAMLNPDIVLVGEERFRKYWRDEYRMIRESRSARKARRKAKPKKAAQVLELVRAEA